MAFKIVLDAGHGYNTAGKRLPDGSMREWEFNSVVVKYAADELAKFEGVATMFVHDVTGATDVTLSERTRKANAWGADVYVSIHANAATGQWGSANGIETYVYVTRPADAVRLANQVQAELIKFTGRFNRGVKAADFHVLRETNMTAILCECGFMDNREEAALLKSDDYRRKCAEAIVNGLALVYGLKRKAAPAPEPVSVPAAPAAPVNGRKEDMKGWIEALGAKGLILDVEGWKAKVDAGITTEDLAYLALALFSRIAK